MGNQAQGSSRKGHSTIHYSNGDTYTGEMENGMKNGKGTLIYANKDRYDGHWLKNMKHGSGTLYYCNGELYIGEWAENKKHGMGKYFYQKGERYIGHWKKNFKDGDGTMYFPDGSHFKGHFQGNKKHGIGKSYLNDGTVFDEEWNDGVLVRRTPVAAEARPTTIGSTTVSQNLTKSPSNTVISPPKSKEEIVETANLGRNTSKELQQEKPDGNAPNGKIPLIPQMDEEPIETEVQSEVGFNTLLEDNLKSQAEGPYETGELLSDFKSEPKELGYETLTFIDQMELLNSINHTVMKKACK